MDEQRTGARKGSRRAARAPASSRLATVGLGTASGLALVAWLLLVIAAIRFAQSARGGEPTAWFFMALASAGAMACLFLSLVLGWRVTLAGRDARGARHQVAGAGKRSAGRRSR